MRSKTVSLKIPHRLYDAYVKLAVRCGYPSVSALLVLNPLYALMVNAEHSITAPLANLTPEAQDEIIERVVSAWERDEFTHGSFFEKTLAEVAAKLKLDVSPEIFGVLVSDTMRKQRSKRS